MNDLCQNKGLVTALLADVQSHISGALERFEVPQGLVLAPEPWTPANGLVTAAMKNKRKPIQVRYQDQIDKVYRQIAKNARRGTIM